MTKYKSLYKKIISLTELSEVSLEKLFNAVIVKDYKKGETLLEEGQICKNIYFVEKGYLRLFTYKDGVEINTDFIFEDNFTTSLKSLRLSVPSNTIIQAGENSTILSFDKGRLLSLYNESPEIESFGRKLLEQLLTIQEDHSNFFKIFAAAERYRYIQENNPQLIQRVPLSKIASYLGVARETLSRIRKQK